MKINRSYIFIAISSIALAIVLSIQVNWIFETAKIREELFNEKANMVLSKTAEALSSDKETFKNLQICVGTNEVRKIDSLFNHYMKFYNIKIAYFFEVKPDADITSIKAGLSNLTFPAQSGCYKTCVTNNGGLSGDSGKNGLELKLVFPDKDEFIMNEMGIPFITSISLILIVLVMLWRTTLSLIKEKKISEHTTSYLNNMTHEFKTPLTNIALAGKMMVKDSNIKQEDKIKHYSGIILAENEKLRLQVEQVLSMTALERGEIPLQKTDIDFHQLITDSLKCISVQIENKHGNIKLNLEAEKFQVFGDKTHLTNALCNLVDNAIKYSKETPELIIKTSNIGQNIILKISDNGIGIENEYHEKVFDKFFRVPTGNVHDVKGFGLGLTYVKEIFESHGGVIELQSEKENGTIFTITLPNV